MKKKYSKILVLLLVLTVAFSITVGNVFATTEPAPGTGTEAGGTEEGGNKPQPEPQPEPEEKPAEKTEEEKKALLDAKKEELRKLENEIAETEKFIKENPGSEGKNAAYLEICKEEAEQLKKEIAELEKELGIKEEKKEDKKKAKTPATGSAVAVAAIALVASGAGLAVSKKRN